MIESVHPSGESVALVIRTFIGLYYDNVSQLELDGPLNVQSLFSSVILVKIHVISRIPEERNPQFYILEVGNLAGKKFISVRSFCRFSIRLSDFINYSICGNCLKTSSLSVHINFNYFARTRHLFKSARLIVQVHRPTQNVLNLFLSL